MYQYAEHPQTTSFTAPVDCNRATFSEHTLRELLAISELG